MVMKQIKITQLGVVLGMGLFMAGVRRGSRGADRSAAASSC